MESQVGRDLAERRVADGLREDDRVNHEGDHEARARVAGYRGFEVVKMLSVLVCQCSIPA